MNLLTLPIRQAATLVLDGAKQLDEFPSSRRGAVEREVEKIKSERLAAAEAAEKAANSKKTVKKNASEK